MSGDTISRWSGLKATGAAVLTVAATPIASPAAYAANPQITVDLSSSTGAVTYGAGGSLYGLAENGTLAPDKLSGLKVRSIGQMAPGGSSRTRPTTCSSRSTSRTGSGTAPPAAS